MGQYGKTLKDSFVKVKPSLILKPMGEADKFFYKRNFQFFLKVLKVKFQLWKS